MTDPIITEVEFRGETEEYKITLTISFIHHDKLKPQFAFNSWLKDGEMNQIVGEEMSLPEAILVNDLLTQGIEYLQLSKYGDKEDPVGL